MDKHRLTVVESGDVFVVEERFDSAWPDVVILSAVAFPWVVARAAGIFAARVWDAFFTAWWGISWLADALWFIMSWEVSTETLSFLGKAPLQFFSFTVWLITESTSVSIFAFAGVWDSISASTIDTAQQRLAFRAVISSVSFLALANSWQHTVAVFGIAVLTDSCSSERQK